jgi:POT family proton-dependent oligopeptide transporter
MSRCAGALCLEPDALGVLNPLLIILLIPLFDQALMPCLERCGTDAAGRRSSWRYPSPLRRIAAGMQVAALSFAASAALQAAIDAAPPHSVSQFWQVPQFLLLTVSEILVSITGLEFAYAQSPPDMKSTVLALYFVSISIGDLLTALLYTGERGFFALEGGRRRPATASLPRALFLWRSMRTVCLNPPPHTHSHTPPFTQA